MWIHATGHFRYVDPCHWSFQICGSMPLVISDMWIHATGHFRYVDPCHWSFQICGSMSLVISDMWIHVTGHFRYVDPCHWSFHIIWIHATGHFILSGSMPLVISYYLDPCHWWPNTLTLNKMVVPVGSFLIHIWILGIQM